MGRRAGFQQRVFVTPAESITDLDAITSEEVEAAIEITADLPAPVNFAGTSNFIDISDVSSRQDKQMLGTFSPGTIEFEVYKDDETQTAYDALDDEGEFVIIKFEHLSASDDEPGAGDVYDAAHVQVGTKADVASGRNESRRSTVPCAVVGEIVRDAVLDGSS